jgi:hypothetical protein
MIKTNNLSPLTFTIPISNPADDSTPSHITGQLIFRMNSYTEQSGEVDRCLSCRFYFDPKCWVVSDHGLVYGDDSFIKELWRRLDARGWQCPEALDYSEAGMQGHEYIDMDVDNSKEVLLDLLQSGTTVVDKWPDERYSKHVEEVVLNPS